MRAPQRIAGYAPARDAGACIFAGDAAARAVQFFPRFLRHHKAHSGPFHLERWQRVIIATLLGWRRPDGTRRYREALIAVPRKNGKTHLGAGIALYLLLADHERGPEVYSAAYSREQASLVFEAAAGMVRANPSLAGRTKIVDSSRRILGGGGRYVALPAEAANAHGYSPSGVIFDELHTQRTRELYDVLKSGTGARRQPLFISITTAGWDRHSICYETWQYARQVRDGVIRDPYFLPVIYEAPETADWQKPSVWSRCNPNLGVSISEEFLREECERAKALPSYENTFRNLYLNQWTEQIERWLSMDVWRRCEAEPAAELDDQTAWAGLDLSSNTDLTALALVNRAEDGGYWLRAWFWLPAESMHERVHRDRVPYDAWSRDGWITLQPGASIDHDRLVRDVARILRENACHQIAIDRWNAEHVIRRLSDEGFDAIKFGQGFASMSGPTKLFEQLVLDRKLQHAPNPVLDWCAANVAVSRDAAENLKPDKAKSTERIDGIVAAIMALGIASLAREVTGSLVIL